jgi:hypothetical protein
MAIGDMSLGAVFSTDDELIPLKSIESINYNFAEKEDQVINALKDDIIIRVTTLSGRQHMVSMRQLMEDWPNEEISTVTEMKTTFSQQWRDLINR